jgi:asparagine synthase (glutamine-hydrolysing)
MIATLKHRGPDHLGVHVEPYLGLAHARLSIVDLSERANQPMADVDGLCLITFNGEIYNYKEVRGDLQKLGHRFATDSDTEVVLEAYKEWGDGFLDRLNGMWAFALWDRRTKRLLLSRDRFGVKPLFLHHDGRRLLFASEIKGLLAAGVRAKLDVRTLNSIIYYAGGDRDTLSMFRGIDSLPAGECLSIAADGALVRWRWWKTLDHLVDVPRRFDERVERFRELLFDAVRIRLRTDVPTAISLSSGLDSSSVFAAWHVLLGQGRASSATDERPVRPIPFVAAFPGFAIDESVEAGALARRFGDEPELVHVTADRFRKDVEEVTWHQESLVWSAAVIAFHELYRSMSVRGIRVVIEGHGSDELLGGYVQFPRLLIGEALRRFRLSKAWEAAVAVSRTLGPMHDEPARTPASILASIVRRRFQRRTESPPMHLFQSDFLGKAERLEPADRGSGSPLHRALDTAFHARSLPTILRMFDRATMAHGVESRSPFLDWRLVTYSLSLPDSDAIGKGWTKRIQREAMRGFLPDETLWRERKIGFSLPLPQWLAIPSVSRVLRESLTDGTMDGVPEVRRDAYQQLLGEAINQRLTWRSSQALWQAYSYAVWHDRFFRTSVPTPDAEEGLDRAGIAR